MPYEKGWTAYVDGKEVEIEKVNVGFMAVLVGEGEHTVRFEYTAPGLKAGIITTASASVIFAVYMLLWALYKKKNPEKCVVRYPEGQKLAAKWAEEDRLLAEYEESLAAETEETDLDADLPEMFIITQEPETEDRVNDENDPLKIEDGFDNDGDDKESEVK